MVAKNQPERNLAKHTSVQCTNVRWRARRSLNGLGLGKCIEKYLRAIFLFFLEQVGHDFWPSLSTKVLHKHCKSQLLLQCSKELNKTMELVFNTDAHCS